MYPSNKNHVSHPITIKNMKFEREVFVNNPFNLVKDVSNIKGALRKKGF